MDHDRSRIIRALAETKIFYQMRGNPRATDENTLFAAALRALYTNLLYVLMCARVGLYDCGGAICADGRELMQILWNL